MRFLWSNASTPLKTNEKCPLIQGTNIRNIGNFPRLQPWKFSAKHLVVSQVDPSRFPQLLAIHSINGTFQLLFCILQEVSCGFLWFWPQNPQPSGNHTGFCIENPYNPMTDPWDDCIFTWMVDVSCNLCFLNIRPMDPMGSRLDPRWSIKRYDIYIYDIYISSRVGDIWVLATRKCWEKKSRWIPWA